MVGVTSLHVSPASGLATHAAAADVDIEPHVPAAADPASTTDKEKSESPAIGKGGRAAMWQPPGRTGSLLHNGGAPGKSSSGVMPMEVDRAGPAETDRGPSIAQEC
jgi:hypothetical protein